MFKYQKTCPGCQERMNSNAFPRNSAFCYGCRDKMREQQKARRRPR